MATDAAGLKQLGFIPQYADASVKYAESWVNYTNEKLPASLKPKAQDLEQKISTTVAPVISTLTDKSDKILHAVDTQVDAAVKTASTVIENQKQFHAQNLEQYKAAREAYLRRIESMVDFVKQKGLSGCAQSLADTVKAQVDRVRVLPAAAVDAAKSAMEGLTSAFNKLMEHPQVKAMVEKFKPHAEFAWGKYLTLHDAVVANGAYSFAYDKACSILGFAQGTSLYKAAEGRVSPWVSPYTEPLVQAGYYQALLDHVKPIAK